MCIALDSSDIPWRRGDDSLGKGSGGPYVAAPTSRHLRRGTYVAAPTSRALLTGGTRLTKAARQECGTEFILHLEGGERVGDFIARIRRMTTAAVQLSDAFTIFIFLGEILLNFCSAGPIICVNAAFWPVALVERGERRGGGRRRRNCTPSRLEIYKTPNRIYEGILRKLPTTPYL
jgi:hypothetical protein